MKNNKIVKKLIVMLYKVRYIMPVGAQKPVVIEDLDTKIKKASLPYYLIIDGKISFSSLSELNKDKIWLMKKAKLDKKSIKNVLLVSYNPETEKIILQTKK